MRANQNSSKAAGLVILALLAAGALSTVSARNAKTYGKALSAGKTVPIEQLLEHPDEFIGKTVKVEGLVNGVCEKRGCWISLASRTAEAKEIRVKVEDGVIVFPVEAKGKTAVAEGVFTRVEMNLDQTRAYRKHQAEERGEEFDPASVTEPMVFYQLKGLGAEIY